MSQQPPVRRSACPQPGSAESATVQHMTVTAQQWLAGFAAELGIDPPDDDQVAQLLGVAAVAARASERTAAPISCWLAAIAGLTPQDALSAARRVARNLGQDTAS
jgi:DNA-directed RNA polymerase specialized sigma24 family protein